MIRSINFPVAVWSQHSKIRRIRPASGGSRDIYTRHDVSVRSKEVFMEHRAPANSTVSTNHAVSSETHREGHGTWVLTAYAISGLVLLGVLAYYFSGFVTH